MLYRFARFELDDEKRTFRSSGGELALQPLIFDLLVHLVRNRSRVVSKEELVDRVWGVAAITDGAVQRAVSILRSALRAGGAESAIRTYPRQGYRFSADVSEDTAAESAAPAATRDLLNSARSAFGREEWALAADAFREADLPGGLEAADLERWARSSEALGRLKDAVVAFERAVAAYSAAGASRDAARAALRLANVQLERREFAVAGGWLRRGTRYLQGAEPSHEVALAEWLMSRFALYEGEMEKSLAHADTAYDLACRLGDRDVEALAILYRGLALLALGKVRPGVELLDEAAAAVLAEDLQPFPGGMIYCGVIWSCLNRGDWRRAAEWTDHFTRWCSTSAVCGYPGLCRLHRAEILTLQGNIDEAEIEAKAAAVEVAEAIPVVEGDAHRVLGEIQFARGDFKNAEASFRKAHQLGWDPNPGYALLQAAQGNLDLAIRTLESALVSKGWSVRQRRGLVLANLVTLAAEAGNLERAREALAELESHPELWEASAASAMFSRGRGALRLAEGDPLSAVSNFRESMRIWRDLGSPLQMAEVRLRLACALAAAGDREGAELELKASEGAYRGAGLDELLRVCERVRQKIGRIRGQSGSVSR